MKVTPPPVYDEACRDAVLPLQPGNIHHILYGANHCTAVGQDLQSDASLNSSSTGSSSGGRFTPGALICPATLQLKQSTFCFTPVSLVVE